MESTIGLYKTECITPATDGKNWGEPRDVERETAEWVRWYNHERIHSSIDYMTQLGAKSCMLTPSPNGARWPEPQPLANPGRFRTPAEPGQPDQLDQPVEGHLGAARAAAPAHRALRATPHPRRPIGHTNGPGRQCHSRGSVALHPGPPLRTHRHRADH